MQSSQIYTLPELIAAISKDTTFEADFLYLPRAATLETEFIETVRKNGPTGEFEGQILVGHTNLLSDPTHSQRRPVWSYVAFDPENGSRPRIFRYSLCDGRDLMNCSRVAFLEPFARIAEIFEQEGRHWDDAISSILEFYYLETGFVQHMSLSRRRLKDFKKACSIYAASLRLQNKQPNRKPHVEASLPGPHRRAYVALSDGLHNQNSAPHNSVGSYRPSKRRRYTSEAEGHDSGVHVGDSNSEEPNKRPRQDDFTEEFQRLVQRIRKHADADSNAYKAEIERLKLSTTRIQQENKDAEHLLEAECTNTVNLSSQISLLRARNKELEQTMHQTNEAQEHKIKEIEKELQELREFKQKVKGLFRG